jgi:hypothetical protein
MNIPPAPIGPTKSNSGRAQTGPARSITLRRDGKGALKFNGERIKSATRNKQIDYSNDPQFEEWNTFEISAKLFKTAAGKYVLGVEVYNKTDEVYDKRWGQASDSLKSLAEQVKTDLAYWVNDDILGELFEETEIADQFVEHID